MAIHMVKVNQGKRCEYCDHVRAQSSLDENGICYGCKELIAKLRAEYDGLPELSEVNE